MARADSQATLALEAVDKGRVQVGSRIGGLGARLDRVAGTLTVGVLAELFTSEAFGWRICRIAQRSPARERATLVLGSTRPARAC